jgi:DNA-binding response OmpR family regulator
MFDLDVPQINVWESARIFEEHSRKIPVILATGFTEDKHWERAGMSGVDAIMPKPFKLNEMEGTVRRLLNNGAYTKETRIVPCIAVTAVSLSPEIFSQSKSTRASFDFLRVCPAVLSFIDAALRYTLIGHAHSLRSLRLAIFPLRTSAHG